jgi:hypothetical protein
MKIKTVVISLLFIPFLVFILSPVEGFAKNGALPRAGLTPESPFYFFDKLGEAMREFFTFNPEGKARLQVTFAAERVAEIKIILETKGVEAKGLEVAQSRLRASIAKAAVIVKNEKSKGKNVSTLAQEIDDELETSKSALADSFKAEKQAFEVKEDELKIQLKDAHRARDTAKEEVLAQELGQVKAQKELLELKEEDIEDELEAEEEKIEEELEAQLEAEKAIEEAEEEKQEIIEEAAEEDIELPANAFVEFDGLFAQAKGVLQAGNFAEAKNLAKRAEKSLNQIEKTIEELEEKQEKKEDAEEAMEEAVEAEELAAEEEEEQKDEEDDSVTPAGESQALEGIWLIADSELYYEFKEGKMCEELVDNSSGLPKPCTSYEPFTVKGNILVIGSNTFRWAIHNDKLELSSPETGQKLVLSKFVKPVVQPSAPPKDYSIRLTENQLKLQGVWKSTEGLYISFKFYRFTWQGAAGEGENCTEVSISGSDTVCNSYQEFVMSGDSSTANVIDRSPDPDPSVKTESYTLRNGKLEVLGGIGKAEGDTAAIYDYYTKTDLPPPLFKGTLETLE